MNTEKKREEDKEQYNKDVNAEFHLPKSLLLHSSVSYF